MSEKMNGYIYKGNGVLTVIGIPKNKIGTYTEGNAFIASSKEHLIEHYQKDFEWHMKNTNEQEKINRLNEILNNIIEGINGEIVYENNEI